MHIALLHNLSPRLEENVRSAFCGQVGVLFVHAAVRQHQSTRWPLESSTRIFICMQNSPLEGKRCILFFQGTVCKQGGRRTKKTAGLKRRKRDVTRSHGEFSLFTLVCLLKDAGSGGSHYLWHLAREAAVNINIASPPTYCKSDMQTKLRSPRSLICSGSRPPQEKIIHRTRNKSSHTENWFPLPWRHRFLKDKNCARLQNRIVPVWKLLIRLTHFKIQVFIIKTGFAESGLRLLCILNGL